MYASRNYLLTVGRLLMSSLFVWEGFVQLRNPVVAAKYFASVNVPMPDLAIWISIAIHFLGGLGILIGFKTRWAAGLLVLLCLGTAFGVHLLVGDASNMLHFYKNLVMAGGFLYVMAFGAGAISIDRDSVLA
jgi:putative oxidoreductase